MHEWGATKMQDAFGPPKHKRFYETWAWFSVVVTAMIATCIALSVSSFLPDTIAVDPEPHVVACCKVCSTGCVEVKQDRGGIGHPVLPPPEAFLD
jgi:hypothetical protein